MNKYFARVTTSYPPPLVLNVEAKSNTLRFLELVITTDADRLSCRFWNSVARNTGSGDTVLTRSWSWRLVAGGQVCWGLP